MWRLWAWLDRRWRRWHARVTVRRGWGPPEPYRHLRLWVARTVPLSVLAAAAPDRPGVLPGASGAASARTGDVAARARSHFRHCGVMHLSDLCCIVESMDAIRDVKISVNLTPDQAATPRPRTPQATTGHAPPPQPS